MKRSLSKENPKTAILESTGPCSKIVKSILVMVLLLMVFASGSLGQEGKPADILINAEAAHELIPLLSVRNPALGVGGAYCVQQEYVKKKLTTEKIAGFKAGLTSRGGQKRFGVSGPVSGVLFESGKLTGEVVVDCKEFHLLMLETEIGFIIGEPLTKPVKEPADLRKYIFGVAPVVELPDLGFAQMKLLKGVDIIGANVSARKYIVGEAKALDHVDPNGVKVTLLLGGEEITGGKGTDAFGDQWKAALWLVNAQIEQGRALKPGDILLTGALGKMAPGKPGRYVADYGSFGKIIFEIK